jgi:hypothetical protein
METNGKWESKNDFQSRPRYIITFLKESTSSYTIYGNKPPWGRINGKN